MQRPNFLRICGSTVISGAAIETPDRMFCPCALIIRRGAHETTEWPVLFSGPMFATYEEAALQGVQLAYGRSAGMRGHARVVAHV